MNLTFLDSCMKVASFLVIVSIWIAPSLCAEADDSWVGPTIDSLDMLEEGSLLDVVKIVREAIREDKESTIALRIEVPDRDLENEPAKMALTKVPAIVVLAFVAEAGRFEFVSEKGFWVLRNTPFHERKFSDDVEMFTVQDVKPAELQAMGLIQGKEGIVVDQGAKWPKDWGRISRIDDVIIIRAQRGEIEVFNALLKLHRSGYRIPKINSMKRGAK